MGGVEALLLGGMANATPIMLAALGEALLERTGRVNLGVEGMMAAGAAAAILVGAAAGDVYASLFAGSLTGALLALVYVATVIVLEADQIVVGLLLVFMGVGVSELLGVMIGGRPGEVINRLYGGIDPLEAASLTVGVVLWVILYRTWIGVELRALGYSEDIARRRGLRVNLLRGVSAIIAGMMAGAAGAYVAMGLQYGRWYSGLTAGRGWIAVGVVILGYWHPLGVMIASFLVGMLFALRPMLPSLGVPGELADASPYLAVVGALIVVSMLSKRIGLTPPTVVWRRD